MADTFWGHNIVLSKEPRNYTKIYLLQHPKHICVKIVHKQVHKEKIVNIKSAP